MENAFSWKIQKDINIPLFRLMKNYWAKKGKIREGKKMVFLQTVEENVYKGVESTFPP